MPREQRATVKKGKAVKTPKTAKSQGKLKRMIGSRLRPVRPNPERKISGAFRLFIDSVSLVRQYWKLFGGITIVYLLMSILLVGGLAGGYDLSALKDTFTEEIGQLSATIAIFGLLVGSTGSVASESGAAYQSIVILIVSLATIWTLRQVLAGEKVSVRDAFYRGMYPLVPFVLVLIFIFLLLVPAALGSFIFSTVFGGELVVGIGEQVMWYAVIFVLMTLSLYWVSSTLFAIYIVALPDVRPMAAIKTARKLTMGRRWMIIRKLLFLPLAFILIGVIFILPLIAIAPVVAGWVFVLLSMFALVLGHTYVYSLYKELL